MDTLFQYVDAHLFACLVEMKDKGEHEVLDYKTYRELYSELRECVDLCHRDGVIKNEVALNPAKYLVHDEAIFPMLKRYRDDGVKVFLLTNSDWTYTSVAMNYLFHGELVDPDTKQKNEWLDFFDLVYVANGGGYEEIETEGEKRGGGGRMFRHCIGGLSFRPLLSFLILLLTAVWLCPLHLHPHTHTHTHTQYRDILQTCLHAGPIPRSVPCPYRRWRSLEYRRPV